MCLMAGITLDLYKLWNLLMWNMLHLLHLLISALVKSDKISMDKQTTFMCSLGNIHNVGDIRGQLGKERDRDSLSYPAADVPHQLWILFKFGWGNKQTTTTKRDSHSWTKCAKQKTGQLKVGSLLWGVCMRDRMRDREPEILSTVIEGLYKCELLLLEDSCFIRHLLACQSGCLEKGEAAQCLTCSHSAHFCSLLKHTTMSKSTTSKPTATQGWLLHTHSLKHISVSPPTHDQQHLIPIMQQSLNRLQFRTFQIEHNAEQCDLILARKRHTYWGLDVKTSYICRILHYQSNGMDTSHKGFLHLYHFLLLEKNNEDINTIK